MPGFPHPGVDSDTTSTSNLPSSIDNEQQEIRWRAWGIETAEKSKSEARNPKQARMTRIQRTETGRIRGSKIVAPGFHAGRFWRPRPASTPGVFGLHARHGSRAQTGTPLRCTFRPFEFEALEFVSDFVLRISNLFPQHRAGL
jgi:hypothetical protein